MYPAIHHLGYGRGSGQVPGEAVEEGALPGPGQRGPGPVGGRGELDGGDGDGRLAEEIADGGLAEGERVPSMNELAASYRINPATAAKGLNLLADDGLLEKRRGIGMFVASDARRRLLAQRRERFAAQYVEPLVTEAALSARALTELAALIADLPGRRVEGPAPDHARNPPARSDALRLSRWSVLQSLADAHPRAPSRHLTESPTPPVTYASDRFRGLSPTPSTAPISVAGVADRFPFGVDGVADSWGWGR
jgi:GntR family transcriptional regulator